MQKKTKINGTVFLLIGLMALLLVFFIADHARNMHDIDKFEFNGTLLDEPRSVIPFQLKGTDGQVFDDHSLRNNWTFMFFGFTRCASVCPTTLSVLAKMTRLLRERGVLPLPRVVMVSIDPKDKLVRLKTYVHSFDKSFYGAIGEKSEILKLTRDFGITYVKIARKTDGGHVVDGFEHTGAVLLFNPQGQLMAFFTGPHDALRLTDDYQQVLGII